MNPALGTAIPLARVHRQIVRTFPTYCMHLQRILFLVAGSLCVTAVLPAQVIPNPSFENSTGLGTFTDSFAVVFAPSAAITDWTIGGVGIDYFNVTGARDPNGSNFYVDLVRGPGQGGSISTTITGLTQGAAYQLSFDMNQQVVEVATTIRVDVDAAFQTYLNSSGAIWQSQQFNFTAGATTATLTFSGPASGADDVGVWVDNVTISAIPEPSTAALAFGSFATLAAVVRKRKRA